MPTHSTPRGTREILNDVSSILSEHYGIKIVSLIALIKEQNKLLPKESQLSETQIAKALYGKSGKRQQVSFLMNKYGEAI